MNRKELVEGARYILKRAGGTVAVFEGEHDGHFTLADGATFYGGRGALRFRYTDKDGIERVALLESGAEVDEPEATRAERERLAAEREARRSAALHEATGFLNSLGFEVVERTWDAAKNPTGVCVRSPRENPNEIEVEEITIGKLKTAILAAAERGIAVSLPVNQ